MSLGSSLMFPKLFLKIPGTMQSGRQAVQLVEPVLRLLKFVPSPGPTLHRYEPHHLTHPQCNDAHFWTHNHGPTHGFEPVKPSRVLL